jgi:predicted nucleotidyltransferase
MPAIASAVAELDIEAILAALERGRVEFIVIGGVAVGFHGFTRATKDVDVVPSPDRPNLERLADVLRELDAELDGAGDFDEQELPNPLDPKVLAMGGNWVLQTKFGRFDLMQWIGDDALWEKLSPAAVDALVGDLKLKMVSYEDLVELKERAGRGQDLEDLERLRQARGEE